MCELALDFPTENNPPELGLRREGNTQTTLHAQSTFAKNVLKLLFDATSTS
jgi:hypothetical protein